MISKPVRAKIIPESLVLYVHTYCVCNGDCLYDWRDSDFDFKVISLYETMCGVYIHTLRLGDHFGSAPTPTVHHWGTGPAHAAWALSPCANTTWTTRERGAKRCRESLIHLYYFHFFIPTLDRDAGETEWRPGWGNKAPLQIWRGK